MKVTLQKVIPMHGKLYYDYAHECGKFYTAVIKLHSEGGKWEVDEVAHQTIDGRAATYCSGCGEPLATAVTIEEVKGEPIRA